MKDTCVGTVEGYCSEFVINMGCRRELSEELPSRAPVKLADAVRFVCVD